MVGLVIAVGILVMLAFIIGYLLGRLSLVPAPPEESEEYEYPGR